ncbi:MAG TPA: hypothetical protein VE243_12835, partial [Candidatus Acidoferrum sp.]|nr:hypothetical protein [Candidatus Acidoferrum sp.]
MAANVSSQSDRPPAAGTIEMARATIRRDPIVSTVTLLLAVTYLIIAGRYDTFRNELYFIVELLSRARLSDDVR